MPTTPQRAGHAGPVRRRRASTWERAAYAVAGIAVAVGVVGVLSPAAMFMSGCLEPSTECQSGALDIALAAAVLAILAPIAGAIASVLRGREGGLIAGAGSAAAMVVLVYAIFAALW